MTRQSALDHFLLNIAFFVQEVESFLYIATFVQEEVLFVQEVSMFAKMVTGIHFGKKTVNDDLSWHVVLVVPPLSF